MGEWIFGRRIDITAALIFCLCGCGGDATTGGGFLTDNNPPVANAGGNANVLVGNKATLDASGSSDPDGDELTFAWKVLEIPEDSQAQLSDPAAPNPTFLADREGSFVFLLSVADPEGATASDTLVLSSYRTNSPPIADAGPAQTVILGAAAQLDGSASQDADGDSLSFSWTLAGPLGSQAILAGAKTSAPSLVPDVVGRYVLLLSVIDSALLEDTAVVTIDAELGNIPPVAAAGSPQEYTAGQLVTLDGSGSSDQNGDLLTYLWTFTYRPPGSAASLSDPTRAQPQFTADLAGPYILSLVVKDGVLESPVDSVVITVVTGNSSPMAPALPAK